MARGRRRQPDAPGARQRKRTVPRPASPDTVPEPPRYLSERAREIWEDLAPESYRLGLLTVLDVAAFGHWCSLEALAEDCLAELVEHGCSSPTQDGGEKRSPAAQMLPALLSELRHLSTELGLSPRARGSLDVRAPEPPNGEANEFEKHAAKRRKAISRLA